ncbi:MAG: leucine-rich repeat domain-containing protein, partial [Oscillospiraceae bacterium]|nr:leucine-rich repeat domain-containing protein [Oscillospiraceae bacterium]
MQRRILSLLLALALLCAMLPQIALPARAADDSSGTCGDNLTWTFDPDTGTLTVVGRGAMRDFYNGNCPWGSYCIQIRHVVLPAGLTIIGSCAFQGCTGLTQLTFPAGLTIIGYDAFAGCPGLTQLTLPDALTEIGGAFYGCTGLTAFSVASANPNFSSKAGVVFNKKGTKLIQYPCGRTGAYTVPAGVTSIGNDAFSGCT